MKKALLFASMAVMGVTSAMAVTDGQTYAPTDGITCENKWIDSRYGNMSGWNALPFATQFATKARSACLYENGTDEYVVVGWSKTMEDVEGKPDYAHLVLLDFATGAVNRVVQLTCDGNPIQGLLCANNVGADSFGHLWVAGYIATTFNAETGKATPLTIYKVDDLTTGACSIAAQVSLPDDEAEATGRMDYCDLSGDLTCESAPCTIMCALASPAASTYVYGWTCEQGGTEYGPKMNGGGYVSATCEETYPAGQTSWGTAPVVRIVKDDEFTADLFYVDGFTTCPSLYNNECSMLESFASASDLAPKVGTNGVGEFTLGDKNFIAYSQGQYDVTPPCMVDICLLGEGQSFEGMKRFWEVPANGLGDITDGGTRMHSIFTKVYTDAAGKQGAYLLTYKCNNGIGVYAIAEEGWQDQHGVNDITMDAADSNAPVEYFNLNGARVSNSNLAPGMYITRQGKTVAKQIVK